MKVIWNDAFSNLEWEGRIEDFPKADFLEVHSYGVLVSDTKASVKIAFDASPDDDTIRFALVIPRKYVKQVIHLTEKPHGT